MTVTCRAYGNGPRRSPARSSSSKASCTPESGLSGVTTLPPSTWPHGTGRRASGIGRAVRHEPLLWLAVVAPLGGDRAVLPTHLAPFHPQLAAAPGAPAPPVPEGGDPFGPHHASGRCDV